MPIFRALVTTPDEALRGTAVTAFEGTGCEVLFSDSRADCVAKVRAARPDLLVLVPPFLWGSLAGALSVLHDDPATRGIPVLILAPTVGGGPFPRVPRLFFNVPAKTPAELPSVVDRACAQMRKLACSDTSPAAGRPAP